MKPKHFPKRYEPQIPQEKPAAEALPVDPETMGFEVVRWLGEAAQSGAAVSQDPVSPLAEKVKAHEEESVINMKRELRKVRRAIGVLDTDQAAELADYSQGLPEPIRDHKKSKSPNSTWQNWLAHEASEPEASEFFGAYVANVKAIQDNPDVQAEIETQREHFKLAAGKALNEDGLIAADAKQAIENIDDIPIYVSGPFKSFMHKRQARIGRVQQANSVTFDGPRNGRLDQANLEDLENRIREESTYKYVLTIGHYGRTWLNNAIAAHLSNALDHGEPLVIDPEERKEPGSINTGLRSLLAALHTAGDSNVHPALATHAYTSTQEGAADLYEDALNQAWASYITGGSDVTAYVDLRINELFANKVGTYDGISHDDAMSMAAQQVATELSDPAMRKLIFDRPDLPDIEV